MSNHERQDEQLINMVNGTDSKAEKRNKAPRAEQKREAVPEDLRCHSLWRLSGFRQVIVEVGGYVGLGLVLLAAMAAGIVPWYAAVPVFTACWIWSALRIDRYFRW